MEKIFYETSQEAFVLRGMGLMCKQIAELLPPLKKEGAETRCTRALPYFNIPEHQAGGMELAIARAWQSGLMPSLMNKYRTRFVGQIEVFEQPLIMKVENLDWCPYCHPVQVPECTCGRKTSLSFGHLPLK